MVVVDLNTVATIHSFEGRPDAQAMNTFYDDKKKLNKENVLPVSMAFDAKGRLHVLWENFTVLEQLKTGNKAATVVPIMTPIPGGPVPMVGMLFLPLGKNHKLKTASLLWLTYDDSLLTSSSMSAPVKSKDYNFQAFSGSLLNNRMYAFYNNSIGKRHSFNYPGILSFGDSITQDTVLISMMRKLSLNVIYPLSIHADQNKLYFLVREVIV